MNPSLRKSFEALVARKEKRAEEYAWPIDRLPTESDVDLDAPLPQSYELDV
jgi:hypothetical protein